MAYKEALVDYKQRSKTQKMRVLAKLERDGYVTRNEALKVFISRLSAIMKDINDERKEKGWPKIEGRWRNGDYIYEIPKRKVESLDEV